MALLNDAQRAVLVSIEEAKRDLENEVQRLNDLLREIERRDTDTAAMNPTIETGTDLLARAKISYAERRTAVIAAANALPSLGG